LSVDIRAPAVAGTFYPASPTELKSLVERLTGPVAPARRTVRGAIVPHAGLIYSGACAGVVFREIMIPAVVVVLAPNHTGRLGAPGGASAWMRGAFRTPLGSTPVAEQFLEALAKRCRLVAHDPDAHLGEHAVEVELVFLQVLAPNASLAPMVLAWDEWSYCRELGAALAETVRTWPEPVLLLASSDMTHYEPAASCARKDKLALQAVERVDGEGLLAVCQRHDVTMCGRAPAATVLEAARLLGATAAEVRDYRHSGWVTGDDSSVVAYAGVTIP
jgi:AmmeMemoRadiSam system protein B